MGGHCSLSGEKWPRPKPGLGCGAGREGPGDPDWGGMLKGLPTLSLSFSRFPRGRYNVVGTKILKKESWATCAGHAKRLNVKWFTQNLPSSTPSLHKMSGLEKPRETIWGKEPPLC